jgi:hypothetical protein
MKDESVRRHQGNNAAKHGHRCGGDHPASARAADLRDACNGWTALLVTCERRCAAVTTPPKAGSRRPPAGAPPR